MGRRNGSELSPTMVDWVEADLGIAVLRSEPLVGGMSSEVHRIWGSDGSTYVVRHTSAASGLVGEPRPIEQEVNALDLLAQTQIPAPEHVRSHRSMGVVVMSFLGGEMVTSERGLATRVDAIAGLAYAIASVWVPPDAGLRPWQPWTARSLVPPAWGDRGLWSDAIEAYRSRPQPVCDRSVLLHRDLHPLNILWAGEDVVGVVDWVNACVGHPHAELGHTRWNLAVLAGQSVAELFLASYLARDDMIYDPWWDLATVLSFLPGRIGLSGWHAVGRTDLTDAVVIASTERFTRAALARL